MRVLGQRVHGMLLGTEGAEHAVEPGIAWDTLAVLQTSRLHFTLGSTRGGHVMSEMEPGSLCAREAS